MRSTHRVTLRVTGPLPPYYEVAHALWGEEANIDSDGDSDEPDSTTWRELTLILRRDYRERVDIDPLADDRDTLVVEGTSRELVERAVAFLETSGGVVRVD